MKKIIFIISLLTASMMSYAQNDSTYWEYDKQPIVFEQFYVETGIGSFIPTDDSNSFFDFNIEFGEYLNEKFGIGLNFHYAYESEYKDELYYIGPKFRYRVNYDPRNIVDMDLFAGLGYGCYRYRYDYYYRDYDNFSYIVPNIGATFYLNCTPNFAIGLEPGFMWYVSTNLDKSHSVGVWNIQGKLKFTF